MIKRNTIQRMIILDTVKKLHSHATADEIYEEVIKTYPSISRATVYRNLCQLCESKEIARREIPGSPDRYDHITTNHYHAKCSQCGKVVDVNMEYMSELQNKIIDSYGFMLTGHTIVFEGICEECQKKAKK